MESIQQTVGVLIISVGCIIAGFISGYFTGKYYKDKSD